MRGQIRAPDHLSNLPYLPSALGQADARFAVREEAHVCQAIVPLLVMRIEKISEFTTQRLSVYLRCLEVLEDKGHETTSSKLMAEQCNLNSAQIRKDLAYFGQFGVRGVGYIVKDLRQRIAEILGINVGHRVCVVGAGNLGTALTEYKGFDKSGFRVVALFDRDRSKIGKISRGGAPIYDLEKIESVVQETGISMAMIAVPAQEAQDVCNRLVHAGIRAILNFAPVRLETSPGIKIRSIDLSISLESLSYFLSSQAPSPLPKEVRENDLAESPAIE